MWPYISEDRFLYVLHIYRPRQKYLTLINRIVSFTWKEWITADLLKGFKSTDGEAGEDSATEKIK
jgi:hypothetical protein